MILSLIQVGVKLAGWPIALLAEGTQNHSKTIKTDPNNQALSHWETRQPP